MPVDLKALPEQLPLPQPLQHGRWWLMVLLCTLVVGGTVVLLWPQGHWPMSMWFWCCVVVFPLIPGLLAYALRLLTYEKRRDYARSWNESREEHAQVLIIQGRRAVALLTTAYRSGAGNNRIAEALRRGGNPLQPVYLESMAQTMRLNQLEPHVRLHTPQEYAQRLQLYMQQVVIELGPDLHRFAHNKQLCIRIRHNQVLSDDNVLSLWRSAWNKVGIDHQVFFATQDDGLMWLDTWLDDPNRHLWLSLEINLFLEPVAEHAESVCAVLLASYEECIAQKFEPVAWIHRPVRMADPVFALQDAFFFGGLTPGSKEHFIWLTQIPKDMSGEANIALSTAGYPVDVAMLHQLDSSFGSPGCAVGNVALVLASEQASADHQPQVVMLQDVSPQVFVVRPA